MKPVVRAATLLIAAAGVACSPSAGTVEPASAGAGRAEVSPVAEASAATNSQSRNVKAGAVRALTQTPVRVVWVQGDGTDPFAQGDRLVLLGFDSEDGRGERVILGERRSYVKPLLTARGRRIVFSSRPTSPGGPQVSIVNWDGSGLRRLTEGFALATWQDPGDGREWVYVGTEKAPRLDFHFLKVSRLLIDDPNTREVVWDRNPVSGDTFQVSADGRTAGGLFPWPQAGVAGLPNGPLRTFGEGCWTAFRDAGRQLFWYFDGGHRNVTMVDVAAERRWTVGVNQAPGFGGAEAYHPRWLNHPRFLVVSGPYNQGGANQVRSGGAQSEVHLGRFSEDFSRVEAWARVTRNSAGDAYPDAWIETEGSPFPVRSTRPFGPPEPVTRGDGGSGPSGASNGDARRMVVSARLAQATAVPDPKAILPYRNALVVSAYDVVEVVEGQYAERRVLVAQWAIRDGRVLASARRAPGTVSRLVLELYDAHPELEGERLIAEREEPGLPLFYDVGSSP